MKLEDRIAQLEDEYLECRNRRHVFHKIPDTGKYNKKYSPDNTSVVRLSKRCERCTAEVHEVWNARTGDVLVNPAYKYPHGYSLEGRVKSKHLHKAYIARNLAA